MCEVGSIALSASSEAASGVECNASLVSNDKRQPSVSFNYTQTMVNMYVNSASFFSLGLPAVGLPFDEEQHCLPLLGHNCLCFFRGKTYLKSSSHSQSQDWDGN
jgi:hypothetical protein